MQLTMLAKVIILSLFVIIPHTVS